MSLQNSQFFEHKRVIVADMNVKPQIHLENHFITSIYKYGVGRDTKSEIKEDFCDQNSDILLLDVI